MILRCHCGRFARKRLCRNNYYYVRCKRHAPVPPVPLTWGDINRRYQQSMRRLFTLEANETSPLLLALEKAAHRLNTVSCVPVYYQAAHE